MSDFPTRERLTTEDYTNRPTVGSPEPLSPDFTGNSQAGGLGLDVNVIEATPKKDDVPLHDDDDEDHTKENGGLNKKKARSSLAPAPKARAGSAAPSEHASVMSTETRGWLEAVDQAQKRDDGYLDEWQRSMDVLLVFATLFGAIVTAFLVEAYRNLRAENEQTVVLLAQIAETLARGQADPDQPSYREEAAPSIRDRRVARLWFVCLALTIGCAIFAMLAKQWVSEYEEGLGLEEHRSRDRLHREARLREYRFDGVKRWYVPEIIGALPIVLHVALLLFGVGLIDFMWEIDRTTSVILIVFVAVTWAMYTASVVLAATFPSSPYKTPLAHLLANITYNAQAIFVPSMREKDRMSNRLPRRLIHGYTTHGALLTREQQALDRHGEKLDKAFLDRLHAATRSDTVAIWAGQERDKLSMKTGDQPRAEA